MAVIAANSSRQATFRFVTTFSLLFPFDRRRRYNLVPPGCMSCVECYKIHGQYKPRLKEMIKMLKNNVSIYLNKYSL